MKIVAISDTHCKYPELPEGDILLHCGDFTYQGFRARKNEVAPNCAWLARESQKFKHTVGVAGNHDWDFIDSTLAPHMKLLFNEEVDIEGLRIYGTPNTTMFCGWAFMHSETVLEDIFSKIPEGLDILISHGPPFGFLDKIDGNTKSVGSTALRRRLLEMKNPPKHVMYGHIHVDRYDNPENYTEFSGIKFYNCSYVDNSYKPNGNIVEIKIE